jgi:5'-nucleotidase
MNSIGILWSDSLVGIVKAGAPSVGMDPTDSHIWYYNGTPSACVQVALDYVLPQFGEFKVPDLVLNGPNFGWNLGPFLYTLSGTVGATYTAVERGIPAIAFSAGYSVQTPYFQTNTTTAAGLKDPATIAGELAANLAQQLINNSKGARLLPLGYGISVNIPYITSFTNSSCVNPPFIQTRLTGSADVDSAIFNATTGLFTFANVVPDGANQCINGDCSLPGETAILNVGCQSSVSIFTVDYDAPLTCHAAPDIRPLLMPLVQYANSTNLVGGLNGTTGVFGGNGTSTNTTTTTTPTPTPTSVQASGGAYIQFSWAILALGLISGTALHL